MPVLLEVAMRLAEVAIPPVLLMLTALAVLVSTN